jgi:mono/diheme cytochrome c family protein
MFTIDPAVRLRRLAVCTWLVTGLALNGAIPAHAESATQEDLALAKDYFAHACAVCHGAGGKGNGALAAELTTPPSDLTQITRRAGNGVFPDERVYETIQGFDMPDAHGTREMPVWGAVILFEELGQSTAKGDAKIAEQQTLKRLRQLVAYLKSIQE